VHGLEAEWGEQVNFAYLDIDDPATDPFKRALGYRVQPHMFLVDGDGNLLQQWLGYVDSATLEAALAQATG
jgi:thioredoxin-related protein